jgi:hypothetical protein
LGLARAIHAAVSPDFFMLFSILMDLSPPGWLQVHQIRHQMGDVWWNIAGTAEAACQIKALKNMAV